jgi:hypothetical protein
MTYIAGGADFPLQIACIFQKPLQRTRQAEGRGGHESLACPTFAINIADLG